MHIIYLTASYLAEIRFIILSVNTNNNSTVNYCQSARQFVKVIIKNLVLILLN